MGVNSCCATSEQSQSETTNSTFTLFPKFPEEIQDTIWEFACYLEEPHVLHVAPDPLIGIGSGRTAFPTSRHDGAAPLILVRGYGGQGYPTPNILHTTRASRKKALGTYTLVPTAAPDTFIEDNRGIYVRKNKDIFYFGYRFLHPVLMATMQWIDMPKCLDAARSIGHLAMDWPIWGECGESFNINERALWTRNFSSMKTLTIVIPVHRHLHPYYDRFPGVAADNSIVKLQDVTPGTLRARSADMILDIVKKDITRTFENNPSAVRIPKLGVIGSFIGDNNDENSGLDGKLCTELARLDEAVGEDNRDGDLINIRS